VTTTSTPRSATARPARPRPRLGTYLAIVAVLAITIWAGLGIEFDLAPLWTDIGRGWFIIQEFLAPNWAYIGRTVGPFIETLSIAVIATLVGCVIGLGMSLLASRVTTANPVLYRAAKLFLSVVRSLPDVGYGLLFFALVGAGSLAGILALIMFNIGIIAKLTSETIDAVDRGPLEAADASGASSLQRARFAVVPMILPNYLSYCLYVFELNIRASVVIGIVGGGGIGSSISVEFARFNYSNVSAIVVLLIIVVFLIDLLSQSLRRRLT
jgi:phosphonate transport system permease protein